MEDRTISPDVTDAELLGSLIALVEKGYPQDRSQDDSAWVSVMEQEVLLRMTSRHRVINTLAGVNRVADKLLAERTELGRSVAAVRALCISHRSHTGAELEGRSSGGSWVDVEDLLPPL